MPQGPSNRAIQRVADSQRRLAPAERAIMFDAPFTVTHVPETDALGALLGPGGSGEVSGYDKIGLDHASLGIIGEVERVIFAGASLAITNDGDDPLPLGARLSREVPGAMKCYFEATFVRNSGGGSVYVALFVGVTGVETFEVATAGVQYLSSDVSSSIIGAGDLQVSAIAWADSGSELSAFYVGLRYTS